MNKQNNVSKILYFVMSLLFMFLFNLYFSDLFSKLSHGTETLFRGVNLNYLENKGAAFSLLENDSIFLICFAAISICLIFIYIVKHFDDFRFISIFWVSMLIVGIGCNLYERIVFGFVRDYFQLTFIDFPVFNISDIFINISVVAIIFLLFGKKRLSK